MVWPCPVGAVEFLIGFLLWKSIVYVYFDDSRVSTFQVSVSPFATRTVSGSATHSLIVTKLDFFSGPFLT